MNQIPSLILIIFFTFSLHSFRFLSSTFSLHSFGLLVQICTFTACVTLTSFLVSFPMDRDPLLLDNAVPCPWGQLKTLLLYLFEKGRALAKECCKTSHSASWLCTFHHLCWFLQPTCCQFHTKPDRNDSGNQHSDLIQYNNSNASSY